jgi:hypothetical protein
MIAGIYTPKALKELLVEVSCREALIEYMYE